MFLQNHFYKQNEEKKMKKSLIAITLALFLGAMTTPVFAASDLTEWLATPENAAIKAKFDALSKDKKADLEKRYEECKKDVTDGKLPKGTCKPRVTAELK
jgi:hypothetical protein